jgi:FAD-dependent oxidoreductase domain-containing protein 1
MPIILGAGTIMANRFDVIVVGAGILGLASAYHILREEPRVKLLVADRLGGPGRGNTARSAAAYRDMFTSAVNRRLSQGSISFYEELQGRRVQLELKAVGYLWLLTAGLRTGYAEALAGMADSGVEFETLDRDDLSRRLPGLEAGDLVGGVLGRRCGILNQNRLAAFYAQEVVEHGGEFAYGAEITGFVTNRRGMITGVKAGAKEVKGGAVVVATGAWMASTLAAAGLTVPVVPVKRQLFAVAAKEGPLGRLLHAGGFNPHGLLPFTILPGGAYLRPATNSLILGYADADRAPGLEDRPAAEADFFEGRIRPQVERYFPGFGGIGPGYAWAGHYACHPPDNIPFVDRVAGAVVVGGASGSGIMKADSLGRVVAGLLRGQEDVALADGGRLRVAAIALKQRSLAPEEFVI